MEYILRDKITINRPIVFLCGPYYDEKNKSDRRKILRNIFTDIYGYDVLPLIIDNFLTKENIKDEKINIQLLEEIFAAISHKTYIFLDTLSAASELGLFMNHSLKNEVVAYIPKESDVLDKTKIGYFVKDVILKMNGMQSKYIEYRPSITRSVIATDYATEHFGFIGDEIPDCIKDEILSDETYGNRISKSIHIEESKEYPLEDNVVNFLIKDSITYINVSVGLLFYVVASLMYEKYKTKLKTNNEARIEDFDIDLISSLTKRVFKNYLIKMGIPCLKEVIISTKLEETYDELIYHLVTFCYIYHCYSTYKGFRLVDKHMETILDKQVEIIGGNPLEVLGISLSDYKTIQECSKTPEAYYTSFIISNRGKKREFVKYAETDNGEKIRSIHEKIVLKLNDKYNYSDASFAYKKGGSIRDCVSLHKNSNAFIKYDIKKFFNSIDKKILLECVQSILNIDDFYKNITEIILNSFYYDNKLPLGLVVSPILSDMYMHFFDECLLEFCKENGYVYTRYADDILVSNEQTIDGNNCKVLNDVIESNLKQLKLSTNKKKEKKVFFEREGQHIKYIGVNIVHFKDGNRLSVGKKYIYDVINDYYRYNEKLNSFNMEETIKIEDKEKLFYDERRIAGKIAFIIAIEGENGWKRIYERMKNKQNLLVNGKLILNNISNQ